MTIKTLHLNSHITTQKVRFSEETFFFCCFDEYKLCRAQIYGLGEKTKGQIDEIENSTPHLTRAHRPTTPLVMPQHDTAQYSYLSAQQQQQQQHGIQ